MTVADRVTEEELILERARLRHARSEDVVAWVLSRFTAERRVVVTGLQAEGVAVATMAIRLDSTVRVATIDTGRLPEQTHSYLDVLREHWGRDIEVVHPDGAELARFTSDRGANAFYRSAELRLECCHIRKVAPLERLLAGTDCWLTGLRRGQSARRAGAEVLEIDVRHGGILKVNPVAPWTPEAVSTYLRGLGIPEHPLYAAGYRSIGCAPCTREVKAGEHPRAGRWWWEQGVEKECGMHALPLTVERRATA